MTRDHLSPGRRRSRRDFLQVGGLGSLGVLLAKALGAQGRSEAAGASGELQVRSCILIFYYGGPSHHDTWDMKPNAPREVRGEFRPIATNVPGIQIGEHLPHCARVVDRLAIVRGLHHAMTNHNAAAFATLSGRAPSKGDLELLGNDRNDPPCLGSILSQQVRGRPELPTFVALPHVMYNVVKLPGQVAGFLGSAHDPFQVASDPSATSFRLDELEVPGDVSSDRLNRRESWLRLVDHPRPRADRGASTPALDAYTERAFHRQRSDVPRRHAGRSTWAARTRGCATATAGPSTARASCWRAGWSRRGCGSSASTTTRRTASSRTGTPTRTSSLASRTTSSPRPTGRSPP